MALRTRRLAPALDLSYDQPVYLSSGEGVWLMDSEGRRLLDASSSAVRFANISARGQTRSANSVVGLKVSTIPAHCSGPIQETPSSTSDATLFAFAASDSNTSRIRTAVCDSIQSAVSSFSCSYVPIRHFHGDLTPPRPGGSAYNHVFGEASRLCFSITRPRFPL